MAFDLVFRAISTGKGGRAASFSEVQRADAMLLLKATRLLSVCVTEHVYRITVLSLNLSWTLLNTEKAKD
jgi:hypothetical protein